MILGVQEGFNVKYTNILEKLIKTIHFKNYNASICEIKMQAFLKNVYYIYLFNIVTPD